MFPLSWSHSSLQLPVLCCFLVAEPLAYKTIRLQSCFTDNHFAILRSFFSFARLCLSGFIIPSTWGIKWEWVWQAETKDLAWSEKERRWFGQWGVFAGRGSSQEECALEGTLNSARTNAREQWAVLARVPAVEAQPLSPALPASLRTGRLYFSFRLTRSPRAAAGALIGHTSCSHPPGFVLPLPDHPETHSPVPVSPEPCPGWRTKGQAVSATLFFFLLINKLVNFFPIVFFLLCPSQTPSLHHMLLPACVGVPAQTFPVPSLQWLHCCPVATRVTNSAYSFIPACSEDHACWEMLQAAEGMESVLWNVSFIYTLWWLWRKQTCNFPHRKKAWKILISSGAFSLSV